MVISIIAQSKTLSGTTTLLSRVGRWCRRGLRSCNIFHVCPVKGLTQRGPNTFFLRIVLFYVYSTVYIYMYIIQIKMYNIPLRQWHECKCKAQRALLHHNGGWSHQKEHDACRQSANSAENGWIREKLHKNCQGCFSTLQ